MDDMGGNGWVSRSWMMPVSTGIFALLRYSSFLPCCIDLVNTFLLSGSEKKLKTRTRTIVRMRKDNKVMLAWLDAWKGIKVVR